MLALFETLSFKGWTDIRDVLAKTIAPVICHLALDQIKSAHKINIADSILFITDSCHVHPCLCFPWLHDWSYSVCRCGYC